jgi:hypothetical protein
LKATGATSNQFWLHDIVLSTKNIFRNILAEADYKRNIAREADFIELLLHQLVHPSAVLPFK